MSAPQSAPLCRPNKSLHEHLNAPNMSATTPRPATIIGNAPPAPNSAYATAAGRRALIGKPLDQALALTGGYEIDVFHDASPSQAKQIRRLRAGAKRALRIALFVRNGAVEDVF